MQFRLAAEKSFFLFYGTDWLAFGHFVIALAFVGGLRDTVRNKWLFTWGMLACVLLILMRWCSEAFGAFPSGGVSSIAHSE